MSEVDNSAEAIAREKIEQYALPYKWKQTLDEVTVAVEFDSPIKGKQLDIKISKDKLYVKNLVSDVVIIDDELSGAIDDSESTWGIVDGVELDITLVKSKQDWWPHVLKSAPKIDLRRIEPENSKLSDLKPETRAQVEKMMWEQNQKRKQAEAPKPSDPINKDRKLELLEKFKSQHPELDFSHLDTKNL